MLLEGGNMVGYPMIDNNSEINPGMVLSAAKLYVEDMKGSGYNIPSPERVMAIYDTCALTDTDRVVEEAEKLEAMDCEIGVCRSVIKEIKRIQGNGWKNQEGSHVDLSANKLRELSGIIGNIIESNDSAYSSVSNIDQGKNLSYTDRLQTCANPDELRIIITKDNGLINAGKGMNARGNINIAVGSNYQEALQNYMNELDLWEYV